LYLDYRDLAYNKLVTQFLSKMILIHLIWYQWLHLIIQEN